MDYKVIFLDVDGTIVKPDDTIDQSTKAAILQVQEKGVEVFIATGRPIHELKELGCELNIQSFIGYNGACGIYRGQLLFQETMEAETVRHFLAVAEKHQHHVVLYTSENNVFTDLYSSSIEEFKQKFHLHSNVLYSPEMDGKVLGMTLVNLKKGDTELYQNDEGFHLSQVNVPGMEHCFDVIRDRVNKGYGIQTVLKRLEIPIESSIAFGDGMNDKEMLITAGTSFAMGNAHPDLFQYADHKTSDVMNSGIYNGLKTLGLVD